MNDLSHFDRNKILFNSVHTNILSPSTLFYTKNKTFIDNLQEEGKSNLILENNNNNLESYTTKNSRGINLMFDYKKNLNKKKKSNHFFGYAKDNPANNLITDNKKTNKAEENKENTSNFKKLNLLRGMGRNSEINQEFNRPSSNIVAKYYINNKMYTRRRENFSINFNLNSPNKSNNININNLTTRNKKMNKELKSESNSNMKYQSYKNIDEICRNKKESEFEYNRYSYYNNQTRITENNDINNLYFNIPTSSNIYLNTENNINSRNISKKRLNSIHNKNYNLMNIDHSTEKNHTHSNINSENIFNDKDSRRLNLHKNKNKNQYKNIKFTFKTKDSYICKENKIDKKSLKKYYEETFNEIINENNINEINIEKNKCKFNSEDLYYKEYLSTNNSTCTNEINKINENKIKKQILEKKRTINENSHNPEMFHFYMVSYLQKGKKLGNNFN